MISQKTIDTAVSRLVATAKPNKVIRFIRIADRDITAFKVLKNVPETHIATVCFHAQQAVEY